MSAQGPAPQPGTAPPADCPLCRDSGGLPVWRGAGLRVVRVDDADFPGFYRVIANEHVAEFTDLPPATRAGTMAVVAAVEQVLRRELRPDKINLASLGNVVPHLHWHVVARFAWDSHFPQPIWGHRQRVVEGGAAARLAVGLAALDLAVAAAVAEFADHAEPLR